MVIIGGDGVLCGEGDGFHACTTERGAVATADGIPDSARLFDKTEFLQGFVKHIAEFHIEFAHLRHGVSVCMMSTADAMLGDFIKKGGLRWNNNQSASAKSELTPSMR